jgi:hypothetical protein
MDVGGFSPEVKRPGLEADHSPSSSAEVKNEWSCTPQYVFMAWYLFQIKGHISCRGTQSANITDENIVHGAVCLGS